MVPKIKNEKERGEDFKRNHGVRAGIKVEKERQCFVCKEITKKYLAVGGAWEKFWDYCPEHYMAAKIERDSFLIKHKHAIYDKCKYHEDVVIEYRERGEVTD